MNLNLEKTCPGFGRSFCIALTVMAVVLLASCDSEAEVKHRSENPSAVSIASEKSKQPEMKSPVSLDWLVALHGNLLSTDPEILSKALEDLKANESEIEEFAASHYENLVKNSGGSYENQGSDEDNSYRYNVLQLLMLVDGQEAMETFVDILENPRRDTVATDHGITYAGRGNDESIKTLAREVCKTTTESILLETCRNYGF
ncbi:hypothetical protein C0431_03185 [bacterium]|nr:hypothetical protein [bacterium]